MRTEIRPIIGVHVFGSEDQEKMGTTRVRFQEQRKFVFLSLCGSKLGRTLDLLASL